MADDGVIEVFRRIYADAETYWDAYEMCEELVDVEGTFQLWRCRHLKTVERIIGCWTSVRTSVHQLTSFQQRDVQVHEASR